MPRSLIGDGGLLVKIPLMNRGLRYQRVWLSSRSLLFLIKVTNSWTVVRVLITQQTETDRWHQEIKILNQSMKRCKDSRKVLIKVQIISIRPPMRVEGTPGSSSRYLSTTSVTILLPRTYPSKIRSHSLFLNSLTSFSLIISKCWWWGVAVLQALWMRLACMDQLHNSLVVPKNLNTSLCSIKAQLSTRKQSLKILRCLGSAIRQRGVIILWLKILNPLPLPLMI